jgi:magnesium-transporting ATPase (P-type)
MLYDVARRAPRRVERVAAEDIAWHHDAQDTVLAALDSRRSGLSDADAATRLLRHGPNDLPEAAGRSAVRRFLAQFNNILIYFLLVAALAAVLVRHGVDAAVILTVVLVNAIIGFIQEGRAEKALGAIRALIAPDATVLREGRRQSIPVRDLVPGDLVILEPGDRVPADVRLLRARHLQIDEALLTGESLPAEKHNDPVPTDAPLGDRRNMAFSGTLVATGQGTGVVVETGTNTQIGRISELLRAVEPMSTPLLRQMDAFAKRFTALVLIGGVALFVFTVLVRSFDWIEALVLAVALAVGIVPEGLPAVITITLAIGVRRMAARNAVIRKLPAVETLGAISVICSDKTGTLTRNEMTARHVITTDYEILVTGSGYSPEGTLGESGGDDVAAVAAAADIFRCGLLCNESDLSQSAGQWYVHGDPMEGALISLAMKAGLDPASVRTEWPRVDAVPFDAAHRFMATLHDDPSGGSMVFVKGAAEALLAMAAPPIDSSLWHRRIDAVAAEGARVLAFGQKRFDKSKSSLDFDDVSHGVTFLGLVGFIDPPRPEAKEAVAQCRSARIAVKMITGDHAATAAAIARQLKLDDDPQVTTGREIEALSDAQLQEMVGRTAVFGRTSPEHKLRIVRALQANGLIVAMTGDGVNDAPSLKQADVGTAMGIKGTEAAKEAAEMVLLDDNFASIVSAVSEGRTVNDNIRKVISWQIPSNGGETLAVVLAILIGVNLPMTATQILWVNLILAVTLGLVLAFEPAEPGVMQRPPRPADAPLLSPFLWWRVVIVSVLLAAAALGVFFFALESGRDIETARTMVVNMFTIGELFYLFNVRYLHMTSITFRGVLGTPAVLIAMTVLIIAQLLFTYAPFMNELFGSRPLTLMDSALLVTIGFALMIVMEIEKGVMRWTGWFDELQ